MYNPPNLHNFQPIQCLLETSSCLLWRAQQLTLDRPVLILELKQDITAIPESRAIALNSVRLLTKLQSPLFPEVIDLLHQGSTDYIILEDANITSVLTALNGNRLNADQLISLAQNLAESLLEFQSKGLVYRAFSPANFFISEEGLPIIPDVTAAFFGVDYRYVARIQPRHITDFTWISPEEHAPKTIALDTRADIFSVGLVLYALATGQIPFGLLSPEEIPEAKQLRAIPSPCNVSEHFPIALSVVLSKMTQRDPKLRYQGWEEVLADLTLIQAGETPQIKSPEYSIIAPPAPVSPKRSGRTIRISAKALRLYRVAKRKKAFNYTTLLIKAIIFIVLLLITWKLGVHFL